MPEPRPAAPWRVVSARARGEHRLDVVFADGTRGEVDLSDFLKAPCVVGTVFEPLRDPAVFAQVRVELGVVAWPSDADLSPDAMYDAIKARGRWIVEP